MRTIVVTPQTAFEISDTEGLEEMFDGDLRYVSNQELFQVSEFARQYDMSVLRRLVDEVVHQRTVASVYKQSKEREHEMGYRRGFGVAVLIVTLIYVALLFGTRNWTNDHEPPKVPPTEEKSRRSPEAPHGERRFVVVERGAYLVDDSGIHRRSGGAADPAGNRDQGRGRDVVPRPCATCGGSAEPVPATDRLASDAADESRLQAQN